MANPLTVASVIDKNKIASLNPWIVLLKVGVIDPNTLALVETLHIARNDEGIVFDGEIYQAANFGFEQKVSQTEEPSVTLTIQDQTRYIIDRLDDYAGGAGFTITMTVVNAARLDQPAELEQDFKINGVSHKNYVVTVQLGSENLLALRFPPTMQYRDRCRLRYKGSKCKYLGSMPSCDYSSEGVNGCSAHGNSINYGGFKGLRPLNI